MRIITDEEIALADYNKSLSIGAEMECPDTGEIIIKERKWQYCKPGSKLFQRRYTNYHKQFLSCEISVESYTKLELKWPASPCGMACGRRFSG